MKTSIDVKDIRKGDLIRVEYGYRMYKCAAIEYVAECDNEYANPSAGFYYLLERPEPPFEPYWGMVIGHPVNTVKRAVYIPGYEGEFSGWFTNADSKTLQVRSWQTNDWVKQKLAEGWVVIEKPEGVK